MMTVDLYIFEQKEPQRSILDYLHHLILHIQPDINYSLKWNIPFYTGDNSLLYLNPIKRPHSAVEMCFPRGKYFEKGKELLDFKSRKVVGGYTVESLECADEKAIQLLINEAILTDKRMAGSSPWK